MYKSAFDNLGSVYASDNSSSSEGSIFDNNTSVHQESEGLFDSVLKPDYLKSVTSTDPFSNNSLAGNEFDQGLHENLESHYLDNNELDSVRDDMGQIDRSREVDDLMNVDHTKMVSIQGRYTKTNTIEDQSLLADRDSGLTFQERRTNTNSVEDNSIYNDESVMLAQDWHEMLIADKESRKKPEVTPRSGPTALEFLQEEKANADTGIMTEDQERSENIQHVTTDSSASLGDDTKTKQNYSTLIEEDNEESNLKSKNKLKRKVTNYNQIKYSDVENDDDEMSKNIGHTVQRTMSDYLSKY